MQNKEHLVRRLVLTGLVLIGFAVPVFAQEVLIPDPNLNAVVREALQKPVGPLTPQDMLSLTGLSAIFRNITNVQGLEAAQNLVSLDLQDNGITEVNILTNLTKLTVLDLSENRFSRLTIPGGMTNLMTLRLENGRLTNLSLSEGLTNLTSLRVGFNQLSDLALPADMTNLTELSAFQNQLTNLTLPPSLANLGTLNLDGNHLSSLQLPAGLTKLSFVALGGNQLTSFTVLADMTNMTALRINDNQLTNLTLCTGLNHLSLLVASRNQLSSLTFPPGLSSLAFLELSSNQFTNLTLPPDMQQLIALFVADNPLTAFVLSEPLAATGMASVVDSLGHQGVSVFTYPLIAQLVRPLMVIGAFKFAITGPPGDYIVLGSTNLTTWRMEGVARNPVGSVNFHDATISASPQKFYRVQLLQSAPESMEFVPANTFPLGSPTNEVGHRTDESPQTLVTLSRGFWISKFLVTQGDYLAVTGSNPSQFPGDLNRPVESVSWFAASNYCALLTQQDFAAGRIPAGSHYRLPTEAEWECAARAGTTNRFYYGEDSGLTGLTNRAWYGLNSGFTTRPVGQKLPNAWGLFDMEGNVWEWCQDWYGLYPGGSVTDPQGPPSNSIGFKVIRGGAWESSDLDCRSARRSIEAASPFISDFIIGFRVVLVIEG